MNLKFIDLGMQIDSTKRSFCFYDLSKKLFIACNNNFIWTNWNDFQNDAGGSFPFLAIEDIKMNCPTWIFQEGA